VVRGSKKKITYGGGNLINPFLRVLAMHNILCVCHMVEIGLYIITYDENKYTQKRHM